jgi:hypothetical protein
MNEQWEKECADLREQLGALQQQLQALQSRPPISQAGSGGRLRWRLSTRLLAAVLPVVALVVLGSALYGEGPLQALFIDKAGNVGIGTTAPQGFQVVLPESSKPSVLNPGVTLAGGAEGNASMELRNNGKGTPLIDFAQQLGVDYDARIRLAAPGKLAVEGANLGIGTTEPSQRLQVSGGNGLINNAFLGDVGHGETWAGFANGKSVSKEGYALLQDDTGKNTLINKKSGGGQMGFRVGNVDKMVIADNGNVGIGTVNPGANLDVLGTIRATSVNGEKRPMEFEVGDKNDTQHWHFVNQDIGPLCGDADGCTMKFFLRMNSTDEVKTISEQIYIEQPDKSNNKNPGLHGWTRQLGGGECSFVLQTQNWYDIVPHPWDWIYVRNMFSKDVGGKEERFRGYNVQFMTRPNISATVIIYDR